MSLDQLSQLQIQFQEQLARIHQLIGPKMHKSQRIRLNSWLKKLCSVIDNVFWRRNRNYYAEVLVCMLSYNQISFPFNKTPPEDSLPKLTPYEVPFSIRQIMAQKKSHHQENKENISCLSNISTTEIGTYRSKRKNSMQTKALQSIESARGPETKRKSIKKQRKEDVMMKTIRQSLSFLAENYQILGNQAEYRSLIEEIIEYGDQMGQNLRNMEISMIQN